MRRIQYGNILDRNVRVGRLVDTEGHNDLWKVNCVFVKDISVTHHEMVQKRLLHSNKTP